MDFKISVCYDTHSKRWIRNLLERKWSENEDNLSTVSLYSSKQSSDKNQKDWIHFTP